MIKSIESNQIVIMKSIQTLHLEGRAFDCDPTYSKGHIHSELGKPMMRYDIQELDDLTGIADCRELPVLDETFDSLMFDPPFLAGGGDTGVMNKRYTSYKTVKDLLEFYDDSIREFYRVLRDDGVLVVKCQDLMNGRVQTFSHCEIYKIALYYGFYALDLFILKANSRPMPHNMKKQLHARKFHSYFWVFKKCGRKNKTWD